MAKQKNDLKSSGQFLKAFDNSLNGIVIGVGKFPKIIYANSAFEKISGYRKNELEKLSRWQILKMVHREDQKMFFGNYIKRLAGEKIPKHYQFRGIKKDGTVRWFEVSARKFLLNGQPAIQANFNDITYLKESIEKQQRALSELKKYQFIIEQANEEIAMADLSGKIIFVNSKWLRNHQYSKSEIADKSLEFFVPKSEIKKIAVFNQELLTKGKMQGNFLHQRKNGTVYNAWMNNFVLKVGGQKYLIAMANDTTDKDALIKELYQKNNQIKWIADNIGDAMIYQIKASTKGQRKMIYVSSKCQEFHGLTPEQVIKNTRLLYKTFHPDDRVKVAKAEKYALLHKTVFKMEFRVKLPGQKIRWVYVVSVPQKQSNGEYLWNGIEFDITQNKLQQNELVNVLKKYETIFENSRDAIFLLKAPKWNFYDANQVAIKMFGAKNKTVLINQPPWKLSPPTQPNGVKSDVEAKKIINLALKKVHNLFDWVHRKIDGTDFLCEVYLTKVKLNNEEYLQAIVRDITEKRFLEEKVKQENKRANLYLNSSKTIMVALDCAGNVTMINDFGVKFLGYEKEKIIGQNWFKNFVLTQDYQSVQKVFNDIISRKVKKMSDHVNLIKTVNGPKLIDWYNSVLHDDNKQIIGTLSSGIDITEKQKFYDQLKVNENLYHKITESSVDCMKLIKPDGTIIYANQSAFKNHHTTKKQMINKKLWEIPPFDISKQVKIDFLSLKNEVLTREYKTTTKNGYKYIFRTYVPILNENKELAQVFVQCRDITEIRAIKKKIEDNNERYNAIFTHTERLIYDYKIADGSITWYGSVEDLVGYSAQEMTKKINIKRWGKMIHPEDRAKAINDLSVSLKNKVHYETGYRFLTKSGDYRYFEDNGVPIMDENNQVVRLVGVMKDRNQEYEIDRAKSEFISVASHQLRTPLTGIKWFSELILSEKTGVLSAKQKEYVNNIYESNQRMIRLVSDLLNVSHIETNTKFTIKKTKVDLKNLVEQAINDNYNLLQSKNLEIKLNCQLLDSRIFVDAEKIIQVISNLFDNAAKYSKEKGNIIINLSEKNDKVIVSIQDFGYGIPDYQQKRVFEKFFRADNIANVATEGTGLGLYIAKAIIEAHGGHLYFTSKENQGSTFGFELNKK